MPRRAFTLVEVMVATGILGLAIGMTMVVYISVLKRAQHTELMLKGTAELRYAVDIISQAVRGAPQLPSVANSGLQLFVPPRDQGYMIVDETTWINQTNGVKGTKSNQRNMHVDPMLPAVVQNAFSGTGRPNAAIGVGHVGDYFITSGTVSLPKVSSLVAPNDTLSVPQTGYGAAATLTVNSVSNNAGTATITCTTNVGVDIPQGTKISIGNGRELLFEVIATSNSTATQGDLRYYPDSRDRTKFSILAHNIDTQPLSDPSKTSSTRGVPFSIPASDGSYVFINLQRIPAGTVIGRTLQGASTTAYTRTNPNIP